MLDLDYHSSHPICVVGSQSDMHSAAVSICCIQLTNADNQLGEVEVLIDYPYYRHASSSVEHRIDDDGLTNTGAGFRTLSRQ